MKLFADLRGALHALDIRQKDLAKMLEARGVPCSVPHVNDILNGRASWRLRECYAVLEIIGKPHTDLPLYFPPEGKRAHKESSV